MGISRIQRILDWYRWSINVLDEVIDVEIHPILEEGKKNSV